jgi:opacity protein-like surface antigen
MRCSFVAFACALLLLLTVAPAQASDSVWTGIVMATNVPEPTPIPAELDRFESTLKQLFGYNQYQVIGQSRNTLSKSETEWRATSKYFSLQVNSKPAATSGYVLDLQLYQQDKPLLDVPEVKLGKKPLMIRGPQIGEGQLVLLVVLE